MQWCAGLHQGTEATFSYTRRALFWEAVALSVRLQAHQDKESYCVEKPVMIGCAAYPQKLPKFFRKLENPLIGPLFPHQLQVQFMVRDTLAKVSFVTGG
jgi:hypothetical protein